MSQRLEQLYQAMILEHNRNPKHFGVMEHASHVSHGYNPLCGDDYEVFVKVSSDRTIEDLCFHGKGCAISKASASLMTEALIGKNIDEVQVFISNFISLVTTDCDVDTREKVGKLKIFEGVKKYPIRVKCATLSWRALEDALSGEMSGHVTTE